MTQNDWPAWRTSRIQPSTAESMPVLYTALPSGPAAVSECTGISLLLMNHSKKGPDLDKTTNVYEFYYRNLSFSLLSGLVSLKPLWGSRRLPPSQQERWSGLITASAHIAGWPGQTTWHCFYRDESDLLIWLWLRKNKKYQYWCVYSRLQKTSVSSYSSYITVPPSKKVYKLQWPFTKIRRGRVSFQNTESE